MKKWMLAICLMFINEICLATDCFDLAGRDYKIDPDLLSILTNWPATELSRNI